MKIVLVSRHQFGYHTDFYYYAKYLSKYFPVEVVCLGSGLPRIDLEGVKVVQLSDSTKNRFLRYISLSKALHEVAKEGKDIVILKYFLGSSIPLTFSRKSKILMDLRSLSVNKKLLVRLVENAITKFEVRLFPNISIVSKSLAEKVGISRAMPVGLGAEISSSQSSRNETSKKSKLDLVYVGSLDGRDLEFVFRAIAMTNRAHEISFVVIGNQNTFEGKRLQNLAMDLNLEESITFAGYQKGQDLLAKLSSAELGLVHVPPKPYYETQPSTKLYEYWGAGIPVLVSDYGFKEQQIPEGAGLTYSYDIESLKTRLLEVLDGEFKPDLKLISQLSQKHSWQNVVESQLLPILQNIQKA